VGHGHDGVALKNTIHIVNNFLTKSEIKDAMNLFMSSNKKDFKGWHDRPLHRQIVAIENMPTIKKKCEDCTGFTIDWWQVVKCSDGSSMHNHKDNASDGTVYSTIIFLNDDFSGGHLVLGKNAVLKPVAGTAVFFDGVNIEHSVTKNSGGDRYIIAGWFK
tara:strand:- start:66 stop:545 length:480 start_codon:yes stop_codon:yes gene_type:complete